MAIGDAHPYSRDAVAFLQTIRRALGDSHRISCETEREKRLAADHFVAGPVRDWITAMLDKGLPEP
jgi:hypothetical protein